MTDVILLPFNTPTRFRMGDHSWIEESIPTEALDLQALNDRLQSSPLFGELDPERHTDTVDINQICVKIESAFISDGMLMGVISPYGPKAEALSSTIDAGQPVILTMRAVKEYIKVPTEGRPGYEDTQVQNVKDIIAFDFYSPPLHISRVQSDSRVSEPLTEAPPKVKFETLRVGERFAHELKSLTYSQPPAFIKTNAFGAVLADQPEVGCSLSHDDAKNMEVYAVDRTF